MPGFSPKLRNKGTMHPASHPLIDAHELDPRDYPSVNSSSQNKSNHMINIPKRGSINQDRVSCSKSHDK
jgi:hypothetical protein